jgi:hypothetical protein
MDSSIIWLMRSEPSWSSHLSMTRSTSWGSCFWHMRLLGDTLYTKHTMGWWSGCVPPSFSESSHRRCEFPKSLSVRESEVNSEDCGTSWLGSQRFWLWNLHSKPPEPCPVSFSLVSTVWRVEILYIHVSLQLWGQKFALWFHLSDGSQKSCWFSQFVRIFTR